MHILIAEAAVPEPQFLSCVGLQLHIPLPEGIARTIARLRS